MCNKRESERERLIFLIEIMSTMWGSGEFFLIQRTRLLGLGFRWVVIFLLEFFFETYGKLLFGLFVWNWIDRSLPFHAQFNLFLFFFVIKVLLGLFFFFLIFCFLNSVLVRWDLISWVVRKAVITSWYKCFLFIKCALILYVTAKIIFLC